MSRVAVAVVVATVVVLAAVVAHAQSAELPPRTERRFYAYFSQRTCYDYTGECFQENGGELRYSWPDRVLRTEIQEEDSEPFEPDRPFGFPKFEFVRLWFNGDEEVLVRDDRFDWVADECDRRFRSELFPRLFVPDEAVRESLPRRLGGVEYDVWTASETYFEGSAIERRVDYEWWVTDVAQPDATTRRQMTRYVARSTNQFDGQLELELSQIVERPAPPADFVVNEEWYPSDSRALCGAEQPRCGRPQDIIVAFDSQSATESRKGFLIEVINSFLFRTGTFQRSNAMMAFIEYSRFAEMVMDFTFNEATAIATVNALEARDPDMEIYTQGGVFSLADTMWLQRGRPGAYRTLILFDGTDIDIPLTDESLASGEAEAFRSSRYQVITARLGFESADVKSDFLRSELATNEAHFAGFAPAPPALGDVRESMVRAGCSTLNFETWPAPTPDPTPAPAPTPEPTLSTLPPNPTPSDPTSMTPILVELDVPIADFNVNTWRTQVAECAFAESIEAVFVAEVSAGAAVTQTVTTMYLRETPAHTNRDNHTMIYHWFQNVVMCECQAPYPVAYSRISGQAPFSPDPDACTPVPPSPQPTCVPSCVDLDGTPRVCGSDGCGGACGTCAPDFGCQSGQCNRCSCSRRNCGSDGCNRVCGTCKLGETCIGGRCGLLVPPPAPTPDPTPAPTLEPTPIPDEVTPPPPPPSRPNCKDGRCGPPTFVDLGFNFKGIYNCPDCNRKDAAAHH